MRSTTRNLAGFIGFTFLLTACGGSTEQGSSDAPTKDDAVVALKALDKELDLAIGDPPGADLIHADMTTRCQEPSASSEPGVIRIYDSDNPRQIADWYVENLPEYGWVLRNETDEARTYEKSFGRIDADLRVDMSVSDLGDVWVAGAVDYRFCD